MKGPHEPAGEWVGAFQKRGRRRRKPMAAAVHVAAPLTAVQSFCPPFQKTYTSAGMNTNLKDLRFPAIAGWLWGVLAPACTRTGRQAALGAPQMEPDEALQGLGAGKGAARGSGRQKSCPVVMGMCTHVPDVAYPPAPPRRCRCYSHPGLTPPADACSGFCTCLAPISQEALVDGCSARGGVSQFVLMSDHRASGAGHLLSRAARVPCTLRLGASFLRVSSCCYLASLLHWPRACGTQWRHP